MSAVSEAQRNVWLVTLAKMVLAAHESNRRHFERLISIRNFAITAEDINPKEIESGLEWVDKASKVPQAILDAIISDHPDLKELDPQ